MEESPLDVGIPVSAGPSRIVLKTVVDDSSWAMCDTWSSLGRTRRAQVGSGTGRNDWEHLPRIGASENSHSAVRDEPQDEAI